MEHLGEIKLVGSVEVAGKLTFGHAVLPLDQPTCGRHSTSRLCPRGKKPHEETCPGSVSLVLKLVCLGLEHLSDLSPDFFRGAPILLPVDKAEP